MILQAPHLQRPLDTNLPIRPGGQLLQLLNDPDGQSAFDLREFGP